LKDRFKYFQTPPTKGMAGNRGGRFWRCIHGEDVVLLTVNGELFAIWQVERRLGDFGMETQAVQQFTSGFLILEHQRGAAVFA